MLRNAEHFGTAYEALTVGAEALFGGATAALWGWARTVPTMTTGTSFWAHWQPPADPGKATAPLDVKSPSPAIGEGLFCAC